MTALRAARMAMRWRRVVVRRSRILLSIGFGVLSGGQAAGAVVGAGVLAQEAAAVWRTWCQSLVNTAVLPVIWKARMRASWSETGVVGVGVVVATAGSFRGWCGGGGFWSCSAPSRRGGGGAGPGAGRSRGARGGPGGGGAGRHRARSVAVVLGQSVAAEPLALVVVAANGHEGGAGVVDFGVGHLGGGLVRPGLAGQVGPAVCGSHEVPFSRCGWRRMRCWRAGGGRGRRGGGAGFRRGAGCSSALRR